MNRVKMTSVAVHHTEYFRVVYTILRRSTPFEAEQQMAQREAPVAARQPCATT